MEGAEVGEVVVGLWHASPGMGEQPVFLGEIRVTLKGLPTSTTTAWYNNYFFLFIRIVMELLTELCYFIFMQVFFATKSSKTSSV